MRSSEKSRPKEDAVIQSIKGVDDSLSFDRRLKRAGSQQTREGFPSLSSMISGNRSSSFLGHLAIPGTLKCIRLSAIHRLPWLHLCCSLMRLRKLQVFHPMNVSEHHLMILKTAPPEHLSTCMIAMSNIALRNRPKRATEVLITPFVHGSCRIFLLACGI